MKQKFEAKPDGEQSRGQVLRFPGRAGTRIQLRFRRALVSQFHFLLEGEASPYHAIDPRTLRSSTKTTLCGLNVPDPEETSLLRHWHSDDQDPPSELICDECRKVCHNALEPSHQQHRGKAGSA